MIYDASYEAVPPPAPPPAEARVGLLPLDAYYDSTHKSYLVADADGNWMPVDKEAIKLRLAQKGVSPSRAGGLAISPADAVVLRIQHERNIFYAGPLAGYKRGVHYINGSKVLVTQSPKLIESCEGSWDTLKLFWDNQYAPELATETDQRPYHHAWVKLADAQLRDCVEKGMVTYGQALFMAGERGCGKSLNQLLISEILGGRSAAPFGFMSGLTPFNRELFSAEHQMIEDEQPHKDLKSRVKFGDRIKQVTASVKRPCYGKNREAQTLTPFWRLTLSVNDEPDHLEVLPPFDDSMLDKIILLHCRKKPMPMLSGTSEEKAAFWKQLTGELPAYMHWIRNVFQIPEHLKEERYGLKPFLHPRVMSVLSDIAPETRLLNMIDLVFFMDSRVEWDGTAEELTQELQDDEKFGSQAKRFLSSDNWCGKLLSKLARARPDRVTENRSGDRRGWVLRRGAAVVLPVSPSTLTASDATGATAEEAQRNLDALRE